MDLIGWIEFLAILATPIIVPIIWMILRGEKSGDVWEGEQWDKMSRDYEPIDMPPKMLDYGWPVKHFTPAWEWAIRKVWGAERVTWGRKKRKLMCEGCHQKSQFTWVGDKWCCVLCGHVIDLNEK